MQSTGSFRPARVRTTSDEEQQQHQHHRGHPPAFLGGHSSDHLMPGGHALGYDDRGLTYADMHTDQDEEVCPHASTLQIASCMQQQCSSLWAGWLQSGAAGHLPCLHTPCQSVAIFSAC